MAPAIQHPIAVTEALIHAAKAERSQLILITNRLRVFLGTDRPINWWAASKSGPRWPTGRKHPPTQPSSQGHRRVQYITAQTQYPRYIAQLIAKAREHKSIKNAQLIAEAREHKSIKSAQLIAETRENKSMESAQLIAEAREHKSMKSAQCTILITVICRDH